MSASGELVRELLGLGLSRKQIGTSIGRNDRLIGAVEKGQKPGHNLTGALAELRASVKIRRAGGGEVRRGEVMAVQEKPARRQRRGSTALKPAPANVRRPTKIAGTARYGTYRAGAQAAASGGHSLGKALDGAGDAGQSVAFDVTFKKGSAAAAMATDGYQNKKTRRVDWHPRGGGVTVGTGNLDAETFAQEVADDYEGDLTAALCDRLGVPDGMADVSGVEMRAWGD